MYKKLNRIAAIILSISLLFQQTSFAQMAMELNLAGAFVRPQSNISSDKFRPVHMRFFSYNSLSNNFKLILDKGDLKNLKGIELDNVSKELMNYFLVGVTLNNDAFWVNLRPDSENEIIDNLLAKTDVGKIMLEADLQLKKDTASFTSPQTSEGKAYWNKLYKKAEELFGSDQITIPTLTRPWIVPDEVIVRENKDSAYIYKASLKIMLEEDYLKGQQDSSLRGASQSRITKQSQNQIASRHASLAASALSVARNDYSFTDPRLKELNRYSTELIKELILPKLTKEINTSKKYAQLRQVFFSLVLSRWFKSRFQGKAGEYASLINKGNLTNLTSKTAWSASTYFKGYQESFNKGEYNVKEPVYTPSGQVIRSYFSGGADLTGKALKFDGVSSPLGFGVLPGTKDILDKLAGNQNMVLVGPNLTAASPMGEDASFSISEVNHAFQAFRRRLNKLPVSLGQDRMRPGQGLTSEVSTQEVEDVLKSFSNILEGVDTAESNEISRILDLLRYYKEQLKGDLDPTSPMYKYLWLIRDADDAIGKAIKKLEEKMAVSGRGTSSPVEEFEKMDLKPMTSPVIYRNLAKDAVSYYVKYLSRSVKLREEDRANRINVATVQGWVDKAVDRLATFVHGEFINGKIAVKNDAQGHIDYREQILAFMSAADEIVNQPNYWWVKNSIDQAAYHMRLIEEAQTAASPAMSKEYFEGLCERIFYFIYHLSADSQVIDEVSNKSWDLSQAQRLLGLLWGIIHEVRNNHLFKLELTEEKKNDIYKRAQIEFWSLFDTIFLSLRRNIQDTLSQADDGSGVIDEKIKKLGDDAKGMLRDYYKNKTWTISSGWLEEKPDYKIRSYVESGIHGILEKTPELTIHQIVELMNIVRELIDIVRNNPPEGDHYSKILAMIAVEIVDKLPPFVSSPLDQSAASPVNSDKAKRESSSFASKPGGIDFRDRAMQIKYEALGSFSKLDLTRLTANPALAKMNLDVEWKQISTAVGNGYVISGQRIEEFVLACNQKGELDTRADELLCFLADYCRLLEKECCSTPKEVMESMVIVETKLQG